VQRPFELGEQTPAETSLTALHLVEPEHAAHRRALPRTIRPEKASHSARTDVEAQIVDRGHGPELLRDVAYFDHVTDRTWSHRVELAIGELFVGESDRASGTISNLEVIRRESDHRVRSTAVLRLHHMTAAITTHQLRRSFGDNEAVAGVDLEVQAGEIYGFLGPNGAGKSTMVKMLCTLLTPTSGTATVAGFDVASHPSDIRLRIGVALQEASIDGKQTGRELLELQGRLYGLAKQNIATRMNDVIGLVNIGTAIDDRVESYSGGMKRRLDLAMALIHKPQILFLDEPTTGLDPVSRNDVWQEVRTLNEQEGVTIFLTTQYLEEADELADRVGIIADGRLEAEGTPSELKRAIGTDLIVARIDGDIATAASAVKGVDGIATVEIHGDELSLSATDGAGAISGVAVALNGCGVRVTSLTLRTPTLDDVFLDVTGAKLSASHRTTGNSSEDTS
jgi:ABC-2 type transport system ATP-binding protein